MIRRVTEVGIRYSKEERFRYKVGDINPDLGGKIAHIQSYPRHYVAMLAYEDACADVKRGKTFTTIPWCFVEYVKEEERSTL